MQNRTPRDKSQNARWSETSDVIPMFPTLAWKVELGAQLREAIDARVAAMVSGAAKLRARSTYLLSETM
jgi:hypothetical protein